MPVSLVILRKSHILFLQIELDHNVMTSVKSASYNKMTPVNSFL